MFLIIRNFVCKLPLTSKLIWKHLHSCSSRTTVVAQLLLDPYMNKFSSPAALQLTYKVFILVNSFNKSLPTIFLGIKRFSLAGLLKRVNIRRNQFRYKNKMKKIHLQGQERVNFNLMYEKIAVLAIRMPILSDNKTDLFVRMSNRSSVKRKIDRISP